MFVSNSHTGSTHYSTALQESGLFKLSSERLPIWAYIVGGDAYVQRRDLNTPYSGPGLSLKEDSFNFFQSSYRMVVELAFGMLENIFGILRSPMSFSLGTCTRIIAVVCKLHNFITDSGHQDLYSYSPIHEDNHLDGEATIDFQNNLHTKDFRGFDRRSEEIRRTRLCNFLKQTVYLLPTHYHI